LQRWGREESFRSSIDTFNPSQTAH
jgi:hypothetical protein